MLNLYFLGKARFESKGKNVTEQFGNKTVALICLLVLNQNKYLSREKIIAFLWPDSSEEAAKYNLRYHLWLIKKHIEQSEGGEKFLNIDKDYCGINPNYSFRCDILDVMGFKPSESDSIESLLELRELFAGDFLEGCYFNHCNEFNEIIIFERSRFEDRRVKILKRLADLYEADGNLEACLDILREMMDIELYDEIIVEKMLSLYMKLGKRGAAIVYYNSFRDKLVERLGIQPSEELRRKYEELKYMTDHPGSCLNETNRDREDQTSEQGAHGRRRKIKVRTGCIEHVDYYWMASAILALFQVEELSCAKRLSKVQLLDLGYIQPNILTTYQGDIRGEVPNVRIVSGFIELLSQLCREYELIVKIDGIEHMDCMSQGVVRHLEKRYPHTFKIES